LLANILVTFISQQYFLLCLQDQAKNL